MSVMITLVNENNDNGHLDCVFHESVVCALHCHLSPLSLGVQVLCLTGIFRHVPSTTA